MITNQQIETMTPKELEQAIYALPDDAGAFTVPQVRKILRKCRGSDDGIREQDIADLRFDLESIEDDLNEAKRKLRALEKPHA
jgi:hypothetical protein